METKNFFKNFGSIMMYAVFGTLIATVVTAYCIYGINYLLGEGDLNGSFIFGSLISSTDPVAVLSIMKSLNVDQNLFTLVFGESILNDAVSIIFYNISVDLRFGAEVTVGRTISHFCTQFCLVFFGSIFIGFLVGCACAYALKQKQT